MEQKEVSSIETKQEVSHSFGSHRQKPIEAEREEEIIIHHAEEGVLKEKTKKISIQEGIACSVMHGAGSSYMTPYALAIGASNTQIGFLASIPSLLGSLSQLFTAKAIEKYSRKKIIFIGVFLQALMWIPMIAVGYFFFYKHLNHGLSATLLIAGYTLFTLFGSFLSPAWNSMMKNVVDKGEGSYFGKRNKINGMVSLIVMLICGVLLNYMTGINLFLGFLILFVIAFLARLVSTFLITKHYDPKLKLEKGYYFSFWQFLRKIPQSNFGKFAVFVSLITLATNITAPFFTVYMLKNLGFNYTIWTLIVISGSLSSFLFMPLWGKFADKFGSLKVIRMTGAFVFLVPLAWLLAPIFLAINPIIGIVYLLVVEFIGNFVWAGFNLSTITFIYDAVTKQRLALCIAYYNILNGIGAFIGATLGGFVSSLNFDFLGLNPILFIFLISGIIRLIVYMFMMPKIKEVREVEKYKKGELTEELGGELKKILLPIHNRFNLVPKGRPVGSATLVHPGNS